MHTFPKLAGAMVSGLMSMTALAGVIDLAPANLPVAVASNAPGTFGAAQTGVWTGLEQSFTALDSHVRAGFYLSSTAASTVSFEYLLYSGEGNAGSLLASRSLSLAGNSATAPVLADFSGVTLTPGSRYTLVVNQPGAALPALNSTSSLFVPLHTLGSLETINSGVATDRYAGGRLTFQGGNMGLINAFFTTLDASVLVTPAVPVPEPAAALLMLSGLAGLALAGRRRGDRPAT